MIGGLKLNMENNEIMKIIPNDKREREKIGDE